jgi:6-phosphogluconolactonase (cycloisomerase 2 family)
VVDSGAIAVFEIREGKITWIETQTGRDACLNQAKDLAISPSGSALFVAGAGTGAISVFVRGEQTGRLTLRHIVRDEHDGVHGLAGVSGVACSPDGRHLYTTTGKYHGDDAVSAFEIGPDYSLTVVQEFLKLPDFIGGSELVVSPDGRNVYATASRSGTIACFERDAASGKLRFAETLRDGVAESRAFGAAGICISPDGEFVYVACEDKNAISIFRRQTDYRSEKLD